MRLFGFPPSRILLALAVISAVGATALSISPHGRADDQDPRPAVIDGDTLEVGGAIVQLFGIDAPELGQRCYHDGRWIHCGMDAALALRKLIELEHAGVQCAPFNVNEPLAGEVCLAGDVDVAHALLQGGYVIAAPNMTEGYREAEASARDGRLGLWHSHFVPPADWRNGKRLSGEARHEMDSCPIKAAIGEDGGRYYYVPTDSRYRAVSVDPAKGERFFCSDEQARQAGWRRESQGPGPGTSG